MDNFPVLETKRLELGRIESSDIPAIIKYAGNIKVAETTLNIPHPYEKKDAIYWINSANKGFEDKNQYTFGIRIRPNNEFIGGIGLKLNVRYDRASLGYWIGEPFWNKGYATEAVGVMLFFGFREIGLNKIYATHLFNNIASGKVMVKNGMIKEGELKDHTKKGETYRTMIQYRLTRDEFEKITEQNTVQPTILRCAAYCGCTFPFTDNRATENSICKNLKK